MRVDIEIFTCGALQCNDECIFSGSCAIHKTAGEFRSEDGFSPEIRLEDDIFFCDSKDQPSRYTEYGTVPLNHDALSSGLLRMEAGKAVPIYNEIEFLENALDIEDDWDEDTDY